MSRNQADHDDDAIIPSIGSWMEEIEKGDISIPSTPICKARTKYHIFHKDQIYKDQYIYMSNMSENSTLVSKNWAACGLSEKFQIFGKISDFWKNFRISEKFQNFGEKNSEIWKNF